MLDIVKTSQTHNGNGSDAINGRGLARRLPHLLTYERVGLAADIATGQRHLVPSLTQIADVTGIGIWQLRAELKCRAEQQAQIRAAAQRLQAQLEAEAVNTQADAIVAVWDAASPTARDAALRVIGPAPVWDTLASVVA
jgi:hypothetical protein